MIKTITMKTSGWGAVCALAAASLFFLACNKTEQDKTSTGKEDVKAEITLVGQGVPVLSEEGGSAYVSFTSSLAWTLSIPKTIGWISASATDGEAGDGAVTLTVARNNSYTDRTAKLTLSCGEGDNKASVQIDVLQKHKGALILSQSEFIVSDEGEEIAIVIRHDAEITYMIAEDAADWIIPMRSKALSETTLTFSILANEEFEERTGLIAFISESGSEMVTVRQKQKGALVIGETSFEVPCEGEEITISVKHNSELSYVIAEDAASWIVPADTKAVSETDLTFLIMPNEGYDPRTGTIVFSNESGSETVTVTQAQKEFIGLDQKEFRVSYQGDEITVGVNATSEVSCEIAAEAASWIIPADTKALTESEYTFSVLANDTYEERTGTIVFTGVAGSETATVTQAAAPAPEATVVDIDSAGDLIKFAADFNEGLYADAEDLRVSLTADIAFDATSSASFNETAGIGGSTYLFHGVFDGFGHKISGLEATVPLFGYTGEGSTVKNLVIDSTCSFTFTHTGSADHSFGPVVGYLEGELSAVTVNASVALADAENVAANVRLGGLAGGIGDGVVDNCTCSGAITVPSGFSVSDKQISIGGIAGIISGEEGKIQNSSFTGTIDNQGRMIASSEASTFKNEPQLMIGGIVGNSSGTVSGCTVANHATGVTVTVNDGSDHDYTGTVVTHSTNAYHYAIAGIAGRNDGTVSSCANNAVILNIFSAERGTGGNMNGRYLNVGGIVGYNKATVSGSDNYGAIVDRANPKVHYLGGVVGRNVGGTISGCDNKTNGEIGVGTSHLTPYGARMLYLGGVAGSNENGTVSNIHNEAAIAVSRIENTTGIFARIGGVIGSGTSAIDGSAGGTITNSGEVSQTSAIGMCSAPTAENDYGLFLGGIVGYATAGVKNVSNSGNVAYTCNATGIGAQYVHVAGVVGKVMAAESVDVEKCSNTGNVTFTAKAKYSDNNATKYYYNYLGGVVGYAKNANIKGDASQKCTNSGQVKGGDGSGNNNLKAPSFMVGGIVGYLTGDSSIEYCELTESANPYNDHWSNRGITSYDCPAVGGIAGQIVGVEGAEIPVSNCALAGTSSINARRGAVGGIVGLAQFANISDCTVPINIADTQSGYFYGGIAAAAQNSTIGSCTYSGTAIQSSQIQIGGGIVGQLDAGSTVDGCISNAETINKGSAAAATAGGIAGKSVEGSTIQNCHYTAVIGKICSDTNFTDGGGNVADVVNE